MKELEKRQAARRRLIRAMKSVATRHQVNPVYPSDTDDLEWRDPPERPRYFGQTEDYYDVINI
jgi:hypothetical protein